MLVKTREEQTDGTGGPIPSGNWAWFNMKGDAVALGAHFFVGILIIMLIECDVFHCLSKVTCRTVPTYNEDIELDEDVIAENERVANQGAYGT